MVRYADGWLSTSMPKVGLKHVHLALSLGVFCVLSGQAAADTADERGTFSFTLENDLFAGTDRDYTNGALLQYISPATELASWAEAVREPLAWVTPAQKFHISYGLGQNMYTPQDITLSDPPLDDRPYAGFLYGSIGFIGDAGDQLDTVQLDIGVVGEYSLAEQAQKFVHSVIGSPNPEVWDTQLENEIAFRLLYERAWKMVDRVPTSLFNLSYDVSPHLGGALGTVETYLSTGIGVRLGQDLSDDYGPPRVRPALGGPGFFEDRDGFSWYLFGGLQARAVARDLFVEGNTFQDSRGLDLEHFQGDLQTGIAVQIYRTEVAFTYVVRSPQYVGQEHYAKFGSVNLRYRF